jgi:DNA-binding transcriptional ArsR family regulator
VNPIGDGQELIDWLTAKIDREKAKTNGHAKVTEHTPSPPQPDEAIIEKCRARQDVAKFSDLFDHGVTSGHGGDDSATDFALLGMLKFYTQDPEQLDRLMRSSALARPKWDEGRAGRTWLRYSIDNALKDVGETYKWGRERRHGKSADLADLPYRGRSAKSAADEGLALVRFVNRPAPQPREFIVPDLIPRRHPTTLYGWGGTAKSLISMLLCMSVASGREKIFDLDIAAHGPTLYIDFELDADEQHQRVMQLAHGMKMEAPEDLLYVSTLGVRTDEAIEFALTACEEHEVVLVVLDSLGPAMVGDMAAARDVIEFHNAYIAPFKAIGVTPILVDHQARQQGGEGYQNKGAFGSAYKEHLSRSLIQVEAGDRSAEQGTLNVRLRHKKANFGALVDPFDVSLSFSDEMILAQVRNLTPADRAQETTLNAEDRVVAALGDGPLYPDEISEATGLARSTVKNKINALKKVGRVEITGEVRAQMEQVRLVDPRTSRTRPYKGKSAKSTSPEPTSSNVLRLVPEAEARRRSRSTETVAELFANPPDWLTTQLKIYRENPGLHLRPLCVAVAAEILGDGLRANEVREEVERELAKDVEEF